MSAASASFGERLARLFRIENPERVGLFIYKSDIYLQRVKELHIAKCFVLLIGIPLIPYVFTLRAWFWITNSDSVASTVLIADLIALAICLCAMGFVFFIFYLKGGVIPAQKINHASLKPIILKGDISSLYQTGDDIRLSYQQKRQQELEEVRRIEERDKQVSISFKVLASLLPNEVERSMAKEELNIQNLKEAEDMENLENQNRLVAAIRSMQSGGQPQAVTDTEILEKL
jgi:hypothetical protein